MKKFFLFILILLSLNNCGSKGFTGQSPIVINTISVFPPIARPGCSVFVVANISGATDKTTYKWSVNKGTILEEKGATAKIQATEELDTVPGTFTVKLEISDENKNNVYGTVGIIVDRQLGGACED